MLYEGDHLQRKLQKHDPERHKNHERIKVPKPHPLFRIVPGSVWEWEGGEDELQDSPFLYLSISMKASTRVSNWAWEKLRSSM